MSILDSGSKLIYHYDRLYELYTKGNTNPVHITVGLTNYCNHRCVWCYIDFIRDSSTKKINADIDRLLESLKDARELGLKAVTLVGDGEPTLHPEFIRFVQSVKKTGLDIGIFTNGSWKKEITPVLLEHMTFIRFSMDAVTPEMHRLIHKSRDIADITSNLTTVIKERKNKMPTVGVQFAVNHLNFGDALQAVSYFRDIGIDYIAFKPVYKNDLNPQHDENKVDPEALKSMLQEAKTFENREFKVLWKDWQMDALIFNKYSERPYNKCLAVWLSPYIDEDGNVEFCGNLKGHNYTIGNIYEQTFRKIWGSERHHKMIEKIDTAQCPRGCKLHGVNLRLWDIQNQCEEDHRSFI